MNAFRFDSGSRYARWLLGATLFITVAGCDQSTTQETSIPAQEQINDGVILASKDGTMPEIQGLVATAAVQISLPREQSTFPQGPDLGAVDTTVCNSCHSPGDIAGFVAPPGPRFELVNKQCRDCHSADYISSQPIMDRAAWQKVVTKMVDKFGAANIKPAHQPLILDYIVAVYGKP